MDRPAFESSTAAVHVDSLGQAGLVCASGDRPLEQSLPVSIKAFLPPGCGLCWVALFLHELIFF